MNNIIPNCYNNLLEEAGDDKESMPNYTEVSCMVYLSPITINTVWRWITYLGYKYHENKGSYSSDRHEGEDVVEYRNKIL